LHFNSFNSSQLDFDGGELTFSALLLSPARLTRQLPTGYAALFGQGPRLEDIGADRMEGDANQATPQHFSKRIIALLKGGRLGAGES
jgi:hypothetical protein